LALLGIGWAAGLAVAAVARTVSKTGQGAAYQCSGKQVTLFDNTNGDPVDSGGAPPTFTTKGAWCVTYIQTYHWNGGRGEPPGTLGLKRVAGGAGLADAIGPFPAKASAGQNNAPNVNWYADVSQSPPSVIDGTYSCQDSGPATWSSNKASGGRGFCIVYGLPAQTTKCSLPEGAPVPPPRPCADLYIQDRMLDLGYWGSASVVVGNLKKLPKQTQQNVRKKLLTLKRTIGVAVDGWILEELTVGNSGDDPGSCQFKLSPPSQWYACAKGDIAPGASVEYSWWWRAIHPGHYTRTAVIGNETVPDPDTSDNLYEEFVNVYGVVNVRGSRATAHGFSGTAATAPATSTPVGPRPPGGGTPSKVELAAPAMKLTGSVNPKLEQLDHVEIAVLKLDADTKITPLAIESHSCNWLAGPDARFTRVAPLLGVCLEPKWLRATGTRHWSYPLTQSLLAGDYVLLIRTVDKAGVGNSTFSTAHHTRIEFRVG
jgi:hypothetical protein